MIVFGGVVVSVVGVGSFFRVVFLKVFGECIFSLGVGGWVLGFVVMLVWELGV